MGVEWRMATVADIAIRVTKGTTPSTISGRFVDRGISFVKVESITADGRIDADKLAHIDEATNALLSRSVLEQGDILFTIAGTIGRVALVPASLLPANTNQAVAIVRPNPEAVLPRFLYYVLGDESRVRQAHTRVVQSVQANFSLGELSSLEVPLPPLSEQRAIAHILGTLDDKIELNRRMSETLEAIALALFKSWFVDFDPVRAKAERRGLAIIKIAELKAGVTAQTKFSDVAMPEKYRIAKGDILFSWSGNPDTSIDTFVWPLGVAWLNQHIFRVIPRYQRERAFVLSTLKTLRPVFAEIARNKQTTGLARIIHENGPTQKPPCGMRRLETVPNPHRRLLLDRR